MYLIARTCCNYGHRQTLQCEGGNRELGEMHRGVDNQAERSRRNSKKPETRNVVNRKKVSSKFARRIRWVGGISSSGTCDTNSK